jgi:hypothetical protein
VRLATLRLETKEGKMGIKMTRKNREKSWCGWFRYTYYSSLGADSSNWELTFFLLNIVDILLHFIHAQQLQYTSTKDPQNVKGGTGEWMYM